MHRCLHIVQCSCFWWDPSSLFHLTDQNCSVFRHFETKNNNVNCNINLLNVNILTHFRFGEKLGKCYRSERTIWGTKKNHWFMKIFVRLKTIWTHLISLWQFFTIFSMSQSYDLVLRMLQLNFNFKDKKILF